MFEKWEGVDQGYLSLSIPKIQDDGCDDILEWCRVTEYIENGLPLLLMSHEVLSNSFKVVRKKQILSKKNG